MNTALDGLVIWETQTGEADRVISVLTDKGVITAYARGSRKPGGKLTAGTAMLTFSNFEIAAGKSMYTVCAASENNSFPSVTGDIEKYALACYFCEVLKLMTPEEDSEALEYLKLMLNCLYLMDKNKKPAWLVKSVFEIKIMTMSGYMPDIYSCGKCGKERDNFVYFDPGSTSFTCSECCSKLGLKASVPFSCIDAMRYIIESEPAKAFSFSLSDENALIFSSCAEQLLRYHADHSLPKLDFYHSLINFTL